MQLNRYVDNKDLPDALKRKLVFGDREQIDALQQLDTLIEKRMTERAKRESGELKEYWVTVEVEGSYTEKVWAVSEEDACEKMEDISYDDIADDLYWHTSARLVKKKKVA